MEAGQDDYNQGEDNEFKLDPNDEFNDEQEQEQEQQAPGENGQDDNLESDQPQDQDLIQQIIEKAEKKPLTQEAIEQYESEAKKEHE